MLNKKPVNPTVRCAMLPSDTITANDCTQNGGLFWLRAQSSGGDNVLFQLDDDGRRTLAAALLAGLEPEAPAAGIAGEVADLKRRLANVDALFGRMAEHALRMNDALSSIMDMAQAGPVDDFTMKAMRVTAEKAWEPFNTPSPAPRPA